MPSTKTLDQYIREDFELEKTHLFVDAENNTTIHSKLALVWVHYTEIIGPGLGADAGAELHFAYQAHGQADIIEGMVAHADFESLGKATGDGAKEHILAFIPHLEDPSSEPDPQTITIPLSGPYGFQKLVQRFAFMIQVIVSEQIRRSVGDYVTLIDSDEPKNEQSRLLS